MTIYRRKATPVDAWRYEGQPQAEWPEWVRDHRVPTNMGLVPIAAGAGVLLLPTKGGTTINVTQGQFLVLEDGAVAVFKPEKFEQFFDAVATDPAPAADPAPEPTKPKGRKDAPEPAADPAPAAEEPAAEA